MQEYTGGREQYQYICCCKSRYQSPSSKFPYSSQATSCGCFRRRKDTAPGTFGQVVRQAALQDNRHCFWLNLESMIIGQVVRYAVRPDMPLSTCAVETRLLQLFIPGIWCRGPGKVIALWLRAGRWRWCQITDKSSMQSADVTLFDLLKWHLLISLRMQVVWVLWPMS